MIVKYRISEQLPLPARTASNVVQAALKISRSAANKLIHDGAVQCRGRIISQSHVRLNAGDEVLIDYVAQPVAQPKKKTKGSQERFEVVHDDPACVVVHKPAGLLTVPTPQKERSTLLYQLQKWSARHDQAKIICVQRLDRGVSGLLVFAKGEEAAEALRSQFAQRKPKRRYATIVQGNVTQKQGTIRNYLATDNQSLNRYSVNDPQGGELAVTHWTVQQRWPGVTLLSVQLETGRRNQIRVHMAEAGHPILGDHRYLPRQAEHPLWPHKRLALHAESLGFQHPVTHEPLQFESPWPQEFREFRRRVLKR